ncbi:MAG: biopolymer transporter ExbD [Planctomycetota bacterium]
MNFNRRRHESVGSPSLSSLIDVVFLLLAYFVLTAAFALPERALTPAISVDGQGADASAEVEPQIVQVRNQRGQVVYQLGIRRNRCILNQEQPTGQTEHRQDSSHLRTM